MHREFPIGRFQRLADNPRLVTACQGADTLLPVYDFDPSNIMGPHRVAFLLESLRELQQQYRALGSDVLLRMQAPLHEDLVWYASPMTMYDERGLPMQVSQIPKVFTTFRRALEQQSTPIPEPLPAPDHLPPLPAGVDCPDIPSAQDLGFESMVCDSRSAFPYNTHRWRAGEASAIVHLREYLSSHQVDTYKATRNGLLGIAFSSKLSPWLALGNISARTVAHELRAYERNNGANDGTYWLWFELVWRDFFAFRGQQQGLTAPMHLESPLQNASFASWCAGNTGCAFVDAAMRELLLTGWMSNRMRQIVASYLINEMQLPWQWGEAWFAMQLIDYDPASNEGNWRYIAGQGADPRGGRHFSISHQQKMYDPQGEYTSYWKLLLRHSLN